MILLESQQILAAVTRSLEAHVLPSLSDDFARVQVVSALKALQEVRDRLEHGDPCEALNARIEAGAREIAEGARAESPEFADRLVAALAGIGDVEGDRARNRALGEALWGLVSRNPDPAAKRLLAFLREQALASANADNVYISGEAVASLT